MVPPVRRLLAVVVGGLTLAVPSAGIGAGTAASAAGPAAYPLLRPTVAEYTQMTTSTTPPTQAQCSSAGRRCFDPASVHAAYNTGPLTAAGYDGRGMTIAIVDSYGSDTIAHDLHVYDQAFGVAPMCGEESVACASGMPSFSELHLQGSPATVAPPPQSNGTGQEDKAGWDLEVSLDVETAHAMAPGANIVLVTTPNSETLGVQGLPQMMAAEDYVVQHHLANVISQSFASAEGAFSSTAALQNLRYAFQDAAANGVTVLGSSGDNGTSDSTKSPVKKGGTPIPYPSVEWPASDPLVTGVGGTYLCTDATATSGRTVDSTSNPAACQTNAGQAEVGWTDSGGGYSQDIQPPGLPGHPPGRQHGDRRDARRPRHLAPGQRLHRRAGLRLPPAGRQQRPELRIHAVQHRLVRHRRHLALLPAVGGPGRHRGPDQRRRAGLDQPGALQGRREPDAVRGRLQRHHRRQQHHQLHRPGLPGVDRLGPGHRPRHPERGPAAARPGGHLALTENHFSVCAFPLFRSLFRSPRRAPSLCWGACP